MYGTEEEAAVTSYHHIPITAKKREEEALIKGQPTEESI